MKFILSMLMCSQLSGTCLPPFPMPGTYSNGYDCMMAGYEKAIEKMEQIGRDEVNRHHIFIKFGCQPYILVPSEKGKPA